MSRFSRIIFLLFGWPNDRIKTITNKLYQKISEGSKKSMGRFVNPDNSAFQVALNSEIYIDKIGQKFIVIIDEFTMLSASKLAPYIGFTEDEVKTLAKEYHQDFDEVKRWYDGYLLKDYQVYNPRAVVSVMMRDEFKSYWSETSSYDAEDIKNKDDVLTYMIHLGNLGYNEKRRQHLCQMKRSDKS